VETDREVVVGGAVRGCGVAAVLSRSGGRALYLVIPHPMQPSRPLALASPLSCRGVSASVRIAALRAALLPLALQKDLARKALPTQLLHHTILSLLSTNHQRASHDQLHCTRRYAQLSEARKFAIGMFALCSLLRLHPPKDDNHINVFFSQLNRP
jgi:hypothetical protein